MTENELRINGKSFDETISLLEEFMESDDVHGELFTVLRSARDFMENLIEEIQQYRAIGTVEHIQLTFELFKGLDAMTKMYEAIGTIEEFKALKEKSVAKKPILNNPKINEFYVKEAKLCPVCHSYINNCSGDYCRDCGQKLDWQ